MEWMRPRLTLMSNVLGCHCIGWAHQGSDAHHSVEERTRERRQKADFMIPIARSRKGLVAAEFQFQVQKTLVDFLLISSGAALKETEEIETEFSRFIKMILMELFSCWNSDDVAMERPERWSKLIKILNTVSKLLLHSSLFIVPVVGFNKLRVNSTNDKCRFAQLFDKTKKVLKTRVPASSSISFSDATEKFKNTPKRSSFRHQRDTNKNGYRKGRDYERNRTLLSPADHLRDGLGTEIRSHTKAI